MLWYIGQLSNQAGSYKISQFSVQIKTGLAMLLYSKVSKMTSYCLKAADIGKITNLVSNDLSVIEWRSCYLMQLFSFPFAIIGTSIILYSQIGWPSLIGILLMIISIPISVKVSQRNGRLVS